MGPGREVSGIGAEFRVRRYAASAMPVNAYLVEGPHGVVVVDTTLTVSDGLALRSAVEDLGKPLQAVLVTHAHPDHYGGAASLLGGDDIPIIAAAGVDAVIRRDDEVKEQIIRPMFGDEWPRERRFPNRTVTDGQTVTFDGIPFTMLDLGPGESPHDSVWLVGDDRRVAFAGDSAYEHMHCYLADGYWEPWLANITRLRSELSADAEVHFGHGDPRNSVPFDWQERYIRTFIDAIYSADWGDREAAKATVVRRMTDYLPSSDLQFLMELSVEPVAAQLALIAD
jgi:glyoxylase-like metal-dependent hydrolase (beta-lactamase superfamily II)